jgi:citrate synthase
VLLDATLIESTLTLQLRRRTVDRKRTRKDTAMTFIIDRSDARPIDVPRGLTNVVVAETGIGDVRGAEGRYHYRGVSAIELARAHRFEDAWQLVLTGTLPTDSESGEDFRTRAAAARMVPTGVIDLLPAIARGPLGAEPLAALRVALTLVGAADGIRPLYDLDGEERMRDAIRLVAVTPAAIAAMHRMRLGLTPIAPDPARGHVADYLHMLTGTEPHDRHVAALGAYLTAAIEHGFNASTFATRVIASTGADLFGCAVGGLAALGGPLHGGAPARALDTLDAIGDPGRAESWVRDAILSGQRIMGFGHAVYRTEDPRARMLREIALELRSDGLAGPRVDLAIEVEQTVLRVLSELKPGRELHTNVEYYAAVVMEACGVPRELFGATFAAARVVGWSAHALEQSADGKIIRPAARYVGPDPARARP